ncbi:MAG: hypothetical protein FJ148_28895, partial [Deltaproteobacteria bacterium]|nr:hypothetical protein [Deltaproteobacteria bacterium]
MPLPPPEGGTTRITTESVRNPRASGPAEHATVPGLLLVHDPSRVGALGALDGITDASLEEAILFRSRPDAAVYAAQHAAFVATLRAHAGRVAYLTDLLDDDAFLATARSSPNLVFTRDSLITLPWLPDVYVGGRMARPVRQGEPACCAPRWRHSACASCSPCRTTWCSKAATSCRSRSTGAGCGSWATATGRSSRPCTFSPRLSCPPTPTRWWGSDSHRGASISTAVCCRSRTMSSSATA